MLPRRSLTAALLCALTVLAACSGSSEPDEDSQAAIAAPASAAPVQSAPDPEPDIAIEPRDWVPLGPVLFRGYFNLQQEHVAGATEILLPSSGERSISAADILTESEVVDEAWTSAGPVDDPVVVGLVQTRVPSAGIEPEQFVTRALILDPDGVEVLKDIEVSRAPEDHFRGAIYGSDDGFAVNLWVAVGDSREGRSRLDGFSLSSGKRVWSAEGEPVAYSRDLVVGVVGSEKSNCETATGYDIGTGTERFVFDSPKSASPYSACDEFLVHQERFFDIRPHYNLKGREFRASFDATSGKALKTPVERLRQDRSADIFFSPDTGVLVEQMHSDRSITVIDTASGDVLYTMDDDRAISLDATVLAIKGRVLVLRTTDNDVGIDVDSGDILDELDPYPVARIAGGWTLYDDNVLRQDRLS